MRTELIIVGVIVFASHSVAFFAGYWRGRTVELKKYIPEREERLDELEAMIRDDKP